MKKISLIIATKGRTTELVRCLDSLLAQSYGAWEAIVVDQNEENRLEDIVRRYSSVADVRHLRTSPGLSRARNAGLAVARYPLVGFPDDDSWYDPACLARVSAALEDEAFAGVTFEAQNGHGVRVGPAWLPAKEVSRRNVWRTAISYTTFLTRELVVRVGLFDEALGLGSGTPWGSGEETDLLLRCLADGARIRHLDEALAFHPSGVRGWAKGYSYGRGMGRVLKKHHYSLPFRSWQIARGGGGAMLSVIRRDWSGVSYYAGSVVGRIVG